MTAQEAIVEYWTTIDETGLTDHEAEDYAEHALQEWEQDGGAVDLGTDEVIA